MVVEASAQVNGVILLAHGATDPRWKQPFEQLVIRLRGRLPDAQIGLAYMEFSTPTLLDAAGQMKLSGASSVQVIPLFLSNGGHTSRDLPPLVEQAKAITGLSITLTSALGEHPLVQAAFERVILSALGVMQVSEPS